MPKNQYSFSNQSSNYSFWLLSLVGCTVSGALMFYLGSQYGRKNEEAIIQQAEKQLAARLMNHGWRPGKVTLADIDFYVSYFKPALFGSTAIAIIENQTTQKQSILLNIQNRKLPDGSIQAVVDFPCGFYQSNQPDLAYKQELLKQVNQQKKSFGRNLTADELSSITKGLKNTQISSIMTADKTHADTARRELQEETGQQGLSFASSRLFHSRVVQGGSFLYHYVVLKYNDTPDGWVKFSPEKEEGICSSHLVELTPGNFKFTKDDEGQIQGQVKVAENRWESIKPYDDTAPMLAYYLMREHNMSFDGITESELTFLETESLQDERYEHKAVAEYRG